MTLLSETAAEAKDILSRGKYFRDMKTHLPLLYFSIRGFLTGIANGTIHYGSDWAGEILSGNAISQLGTERQKFHPIQLSEAEALVIEKLFSLGICSSNTLVNEKTALRAPRQR